MVWRTGFGYDVHAFEAGSYLVLGGCKIPFNHQFKAHSDGDVLLHAICDALLGAAALGDIGRHFPDKDAAYKNIDSGILLKKSCKKIRKKGYQIENIDSTVVIQDPRLSSHIPDMCNHIARMCSISVDQVSVKATTTEGLGFTGLGEGAAAYANVMLKRG